MALDVVDQLVRSSAVDIVVVDSVAALVPRAELEGDMGDTQMGLQARLMSKALRKITGSLSKSRTTVLFLNQLRSKIGVMYGNPEVTAGGNALKFYSSVRVDIRRREVLKDDQGITVKVKVVKNKVRTYGVNVLLHVIANLDLGIHFVVVIGGPTLPSGRVRHSVRLRHRQAGLPAGCRRPVRRGGAQGLLVQPRGAALRPGPPTCHRVPAHQRGHR
jgi:hypothetical protein